MKNQLGKFVRDFVKFDAGACEFCYFVYDLVWIPMSLQLA